MKHSTRLLMKVFVATIAMMASAMILTACSSKPKAVNADAPSPILSQDSGFIGVLPMSPIGGSPEQHPTDTVKNPNHRPIIAAIQGQVLVQAGTLPSPANRAKVQLFEIKDQKTTQLTETTTASDGTFAFTRKLLPGDYLIKVKGKNFSAEQKLTLDNQPITNLTIEAKELKKK